MSLEQGDEIVTDAKGQVQLVFADETRIAIGNNSRLKIDQVLMRNSKSASSLAVTAVSGSFRFITGKSEKAAYKIATPTATMGIRGTIFDLAIDPRRQTALALHDGEVKMCGSGASCAEVASGCTLVRTGGGGVAELTSQKEANQTLRSGFPFVLAQQTLRQDFRTNVQACDRHLIVAMNEVPPKAQPPVAPPVPEPEPEPEPEVETPTDFPGNSGSTGPSEGRGNDVSNGQSGTGTGKGQGGAKKE
nr:FecR domain-containing protein [Sinirhodobacter sp. WL0062]